MRIIDGDKIRQKLNPDDWGTPDERWRPEREFGELIDYAPTIDQWHYPSKGEYPKEDEEVLIRIDKKNYLGTYDGEVMWHIPLAEIVCSGDWVDAWQYIYPPKEEE